MNVVADASVLIALSTIRQLPLLAERFLQGILIWAKQSGRLPELKPMLDALRTQGKFRISRTLYEQALATVSEL